MHHNVAHPADPPCACTSLRKASRAVTRFYDGAMADTGMTVLQFAVLRNIGREGRPPLSRLAESLVMDRTSLYRALAPLERRGWVAIAEAGGRTKTVELTGAGRAAVAAAEGPWGAAQANLVGAMGGEDWKTVEAALARLVAVAGDLTP